MARLSCDGDWALLVVSTTGRVKLFDVQGLRCKMSASIAALLEDGATGAHGWGTLTLNPKP